MELLVWKEQFWLRFMSWRFSSFAVFGRHCGGQRHPKMRIIGPSMAFLLVELFCRIGGAGGVSNPRPEMFTSAFIPGGTLAPDCLSTTFKTAFLRFSGPICVFSSICSPRGQIFTPKPGRSASHNLARLASHDFFHVSCLVSLNLRPPHVSCLPSPICSLTCPCGEQSVEQLRRIIV